MTKNDILCIGEAMVELSQSPQPDQWQLGIAGDTLNTAWYLRRLLPASRDVSYFSRVGTGEFSQRMLDFLAAEGIGADHILRDPEREIGLYAISLKDGERSFSYWRDNSAAKRLADDPALLERALSGTRIAYLSGITLAILPDEGRNTLFKALEQARAKGTKVVFDSNLRPRLWPDTTIMCATIEQAAALSDLILPSFDDERDYFGDADPQATVARYLGCGSGQVVVKAGGAAVHFGGAEGTGIVDGLIREVPVDTTSAGDSFNAGYLAARLDGAGIEQAIQRAHDLSRIVIGHRGALVRQAVAG
ncbi:sugar kinase [Paracoccus caeni]|uniref:Sugar kinase n=1 Tax=Paracoccus caeni TaxID=657651 RepID=A0A934VZZ9_9RHOB|nr:sugar kinase [Paracoccus caeni]MBK4217547.1 sugar kinase [Paracoccus caeni]